MKYKDITATNGKDLVNRLVKEYYHPIPVDLSTAEEMQKASQLLAVLTNEYAYLMTILAALKADVRLLRKDKSRKAEYEDMVGRRDTVEAFVDILKQSYAGLSREITTRQEVLREIQMSKNVV